MTNILDKKIKTVYICCKLVIEKVISMAKKENFQAGIQNVKEAANKKINIIEMLEKGGINLKKDRAA